MKKMPNILVTLPLYSKTKNLKTHKYLQDLTNFEVYQKRKATPENLQTVVQEHCSPSPADQLPVLLREDDNLKYRSFFIKAQQNVKKQLAG